MRIFITGGDGQLGMALQSALTGHELTVTDLKEVDITDKEAVLTAVHDTNPDALIHCAAYTDVDGCARDPALAYKINGLGT
jgi:dTDP-4-dehydrorhamnose reductase